MINRVKKFFFEIQNETTLVVFSVKNVKKWHMTYARGAIFEGYVFQPKSLPPPLFTVHFNGNFCHYFQRSLVALKFLARTVCYTFLEMFLLPEKDVGGFVSTF